MRVVFSEYLLPVNHVSHAAEHCTQVLCVSASKFTSGCSCVRIMVFAFLRIIPGDVGMGL